MFIDTHAHLYLDQFKNDLAQVINDAKNRNVLKIFLPNIDRSTVSDMLELSKSYPDICYPMIGLHPCNVKQDYMDELEFIESELSRNRYYGIGETGIDLYWDQQYREEQIKSFEHQILLARKNDLPVIIHSREALDLTIELIEKHQDGRLKGIFHCFNGSLEQCKKVVELNFLMGLGGVISYKNAKLDDMVKWMPIEHMVLETDAPYLAPVPYRGKRNESAYIPEIARKIAEIRAEPVEYIEKRTTINALKLFGLDSES
jgi:TatD DNase family protein